MRKRIKRWLRAKVFFQSVALITTSLVIYFSLKPPKEATPWIFFFIRGDLLLHFFCYWGMFIIYLTAFFKTSHSIIKAALTSFLLGTILELLQLIPIFNRQFDIQDIVANALGITLGIALIYYTKMDSLLD